MAKDFSAKQIRATQIIASGGIGGKNLGLMVYSASISSDYAGTHGKDSGLLSGVGSDVFFFVSGSKNSKVSKAETGHPTGSDLTKRAGVTLFGGDVVFSGTMYAERMIVQVNESTTGSLWVSGALYVSRSIEVGAGLTAHGDSTFSNDLYVADDLWVSGALKVSKPSTFDNTLTITEDGTFSKDLYVADDLWVSGGLQAAHGYVVNKLKVGNGAGNEELRISAGNANTGSVVFSKNNGESGEITFDANENIVIQNNTNNDDIIFKVTDNNTLTEVMRIDGANSKVVIGETSNSVAKLLIDAANGENDHGIKIQQHDADERGIWIDSEGQGAYIVAKEGLEISFKWLRY